MVFEKTFSYWWSVAQESPESARADPKSSLAGRGAAFALDRTNSRTMSAVEVFVCSKIRRAWAGSCKETVTHTYIYIKCIQRGTACHKKSCRISLGILQDFLWQIPFGRMEHLQKLPLEVHGIEVQPRRICARVRLALMPKRCLWMWQFSCRLIRSPPRVGIQKVHVE